MDAEELSLEVGKSLPIEDNVYRMVHQSKRAKKFNMQPRIDAFIPSPSDEGKMSVDYDKLTTPEKSLARFGATFKYQQQEYKNPSVFLYIL